MAGFPHLDLSKKIDGLYKPKRIPFDKTPKETTLNNLNNRQAHGIALTNSVDQLSKNWSENIKKRQEEKLPELPNSDVVPIFLQIDTQEFNVESLKSFGIEIIAEEEDGFIIGASGDNFKSLKEKITKFIKQEGLFKNKAAQLWQINDGIQWRVEQILSDDLRAKWDQIQDDDQFVVDIGIACYLRISQQPSQAVDETDAEFQLKLDRWKERKSQAEIERDEIAIKRQTEFEALIKSYGGELLGSYIDFDDSFSCRIRVSGIGLKDIVLNYQYLFEVTEHDPLILTDNVDGEIENIEPELLAPAENFAKVCVIDSGIQEEQRLISLAIDSGSSVSFIPGDTATADVVGNGGHGTRVAGAILYPKGVPRTGAYQLPCFIQNARILNLVGGQAILPDILYPPTLMEDVTANFPDTRIFNMSVNSFTACRVVHMSQWAAAIDKLMREKDVLFILSAGNLRRNSGNIQKPGIKEHLEAGRNYPHYLLEQSSRIGNPAQSCFALTVGSVCHVKFDTEDKESFGGKDDPSAFSRTGLGLWGMVKPDVVEYGGDLAKEKNANPNLSYEGAISPELIKSTYGGGLGIGNDSVGTSFSAPKVSHIAAYLNRLYPTESVNLYRALIVQSARLPEQAFANPTIQHIQHYGYGIPDLKRATENSERRITLISSKNISAKQAHIYSVKVPQQMRRQGQEYEILIEVTLSFMAQPRRTRKRTNSYLSTWLDWESSKFGETYDQFANRILKEYESADELSDEQDQNSIKWVIRERKNWSKINGLRRQDSTLQKSWCVIPSYQLPEVFSLAVIGHKGWECDLTQEIPYSIAISFEVLNANINVYEMIRTENEIELPVEVEQEIQTS